ncbi:peroxisome biogenesis factor 2 [Stigmatopora argus]
MGTEEESIQGGGSLRETALDPLIPVLRISQLDALELDSALEQLLWTQFSHCFQNFRPGLLTPVEPELKALLQLLLWRFTLYSDSTTVGQSLLSLRYGNTLSSFNRYEPLSYRQKLSLVLLRVGPRWIQERSHNLQIGLTSGAPDTGAFQKTLCKLMSIISGVSRLSSLVNFLVFLRKGHHPILAERIIGAQAVYSKHNVTRDITYQYMNRELLWHGFAEFLIFLLPLINTGKMKASIYSTVFGWDKSEVDAAQDSKGAWRLCMLCGDWPTLPHTVGCQHVFCYYCIKSHSIASNCINCPKCGAEGRQLEPVKIEEFDIVQP